MVWVSEENSGVKYTVVLSFNYQYNYTEPKNGSKKRPYQNK